MKSLKSKCESRKIPARFFFFFTTTEIEAMLGLPAGVLERADRTWKLRSPFMVDFDQPLWHFGQAREIVEALKSDLSKEGFANSMGIAVELEKPFPPHARR